MNKKILTLTLVLVFVLTACGGAATDAAESASTTAPESSEPVILAHVGAHQQCFHRRL